MKTLKFVRITVAAFIVSAVVNSNAAAPVLSGFSSEVSYDASTVVVVGGGTVTDIDINDFIEVEGLLYVSAKIYVSDVPLLFVNAFGPVIGFGDCESLMFAFAVNYGNETSPLQITIPEVTFTISAEAGTSGRLERLICRAADRLAGAGNPEGLAFLLNRILEYTVQD